MRLRQRWIAWYSGGAIGDGNAVGPFDCGSAVEWQPGDVMRSTRRRPLVVRRVVTGQAVASPAAATL